MTYRPIFLAKPNVVASLSEDIERLRDGDSAIWDELVAAPLLDGWGVAKYPANCLVGSVSGHPLLGDKPAIHTSELFAISEDLAWARTLSRFYRLGRRIGTQSWN